MESGKVLFITTKNLDYIRNSQEIGLLKTRYRQVDILGSISKRYVSRLLKVYSRLLLKKLKGYDEVFVGFAPQLIIPLFKWKFKHTRIVIDFFISFYDTLVFDRKKIKERSIAARILKSLDRFTISSAKKIIIDTKAHGEYFSHEFGISEDKMEVLYLEADKSIYYPHFVKKPQELTDKKVVLYFGSILPLQGIEIVLDAIQHLEHRQDIHFYVIGPIKEPVRKPEQTNVTYIEWLSQKELSDYIAMSDLCLAGHFNSRIKKASRTIPGKAYIYSAMEKTMILGDNSANKELFGEGMDGIYFTKMGNSESLAKAVLEALNDMDNRKANE